MKLFNWLLTALLRNLRNKYPFIFNEAEVHAAFEKAIEQLITIDHHLLDADTSERSLCHRLAIHMIDRFPDYEIDCEYNRDGFDVKNFL